MPLPEPLPEPVLKNALEQLDEAISALEVALENRVSRLECTLREARDEASLLQAKNKNAQKVGARLDEIIDQLETILGQDVGEGK